MFDTSAIEYVGFNRVPRCNAWVSKYFTYYVLDYCEKGKLTLQTDEDKPIILSGPVVWLTYPGPYFRFGINSGNATWHHRFISFKGPIADFYAEKNIFPIKSPVIKITDPEKFGELFDSVLKRLGNTDTKYSYRTLNMLENILLLLAEQPDESQHENRSREKINQLRKEISLHPEHDRDFKKEALKSGLSYSQFRNIFEDKTGMPPGQFLLQKRLDKAAALLRSGGREICEIASDCGFYDVYHFTKMFKKYYAEPPGRYRQNHSI